MVLLSDIIKNLPVKYKSFSTNHWPSLARRANNVSHKMKLDIKRGKSTEIMCVEATMRAFCSAPNLPNKCLLVQLRDYREVHIR